MIIHDEPTKEHVRPIGAGKSYYNEQPKKPLHRMLDRFNEVHHHLKGTRRQYSQNFKWRMLKNTQRKGYITRNTTSIGQDRNIE